ncbi:MAG: methylated-DNA--[protein]-cysteine S-methyltransferase [Syntrophobacter sp.]
MIHTDRIDTPLGAMTAAVEDDALTGLWFIGQRHFPSGTANWSREPGHPVFKALRHHLSRYFSGEFVPLDFRLAPPGSPFQKTVWDILLKIPVGQVVTYGQIAEGIARARGLATMSARAVGNAVGHNRISILIPCHRVVGFDGGLTGYAGGTDKKAALLRIENADLRPIHK